MNRLASSLHVFYTLSFVLCSLVLAASVRATIISHEVRVPCIVRFDDCILTRIRG